MKVRKKRSTVRVSWPARMKTAIKLFIRANNLLLSRALDTVMAIIVTFYN
jgi:hypothetical protein